jgi:hypothetical protein
VFVDNALEIIRDKLTMPVLPTPVFFVAAEQFPSLNLTPAHGQLKGQNSDISGHFFDTGAMLPSKRLCKTCGDT